MSRLARPNLALCSKACRQWALSVVTCRSYHRRPGDRLDRSVPLRGELRTHVPCARRFASLSTEDVKRKVEELTDQFLEARELLDDANTIYFVEDMKEAQTAVEGTLSGYRELLDTLTAGQREAVVRSIGLKMEELRAHEQMIEESLEE